MPSKTTKTVTTPPSWFGELGHRFYTRDARPKSVSLLQHASHRLKIAPFLLQELLVAVPETAVALFETPSWLDLLEAWNLDEVQTLEGSGRITSVLCAHSLSPMSDSLFLLADLGRGMRVAALLAVPFQVLLAEKEWSRHNWNVAEFGERNLASNQDWRCSLYKALGAKIRLSNLRDFPQAPDGTKPVNIEALASQYEQFCSELFGEGVVGRKLSPTERSDFRKKLTPQTMETIGLLKVPFVATKLRAETEVLRKILDEFRGFDHATFLYFLAQRYHQFEFPGALKVAISRERSFDAPFFALDQSEYGRPAGVKRAIYLSDYLLNDPRSDGAKLTIHPYCFPSGTALAALETVEACLSLCPHLDDLPRTDSLNRKLLNLSYPHNSRFLADVLSFIHFYSFPNRDNPNRSKLRGEIRTILGDYSPEWGDSWAHYARVASEFRQRSLTWIETVFSRWSNDVTLPYQFVPFRIAQEQGSELIAAISTAVGHTLAGHLQPQFWHKENLSSSQATGD